MKLTEIDETMTAVPLEAAAEAIGAGGVLAVLPVNDQQHGTATLLVAKRDELWIVSRTLGDGPDDGPGVATATAEWSEVGIGPPGVSGRVPGGYLGGPAATDHLLTVVAGEDIFQARLIGEDGLQAVELFTSVALRRGARDWVPS